jgi:hypothetical protein
MRILAIVVLVVLTMPLAAVAVAGDENPGKLLRWRFSTRDDRDFARPGYDDSGWQEVSLGHKWKSAGFAWFRCKIAIPEEIGGKPTSGEAVGLRWNACDGGECFLNGKVFTRYDNDHPPLVVLSESAKPGETAHVAVRVFMGPDTAEHEGSLEQSELCIIDRKLIKDELLVTVDPGKRLGAFPKSFAGLSQGAGLPDYDDDTAALFRGLGIKWFRMDNLLTNAVRKNDDGTLRHDWTDLDKRLDFMKKVGCELIFCISYMPEALDAVPNPDRHSYPRDWNEFGELVYQAAKHCIDRGTPVKYWEVWNEINTGWMVDPEGWDHLKTYTTLYDTCWKAVRRADPKAWIGGPCVASGPWNDKDPRGPGVNGEKFMRGLMEHCEKTGAPLDFITWHEYFQTHQTMKKEADQIKEYLKDYPKVGKQVKEYAITEWSYAWWHDRAHDNEVGAAWAAASMLRGWMAAGVQKPCWFLAKDFSSGLNGEWGMFTRENKPKAVANVCRMFNMMSPWRVECVGEDDQIATAASVDPESGRMTVLIINFAERYGPPRKVRVSAMNLPSSLDNGVCRQYLVDATHANLWHNQTECELTAVRNADIISSNAFDIGLELPNNSVTLLEFMPGG